MAEQFTREDLLGAVVAQFGPFSPHADTVRIMLTQIERLLADLAEATDGWGKACEHNRALGAEVDRLRQRIGELRDTITDLELRVTRGDG